MSCHWETAGQVIDNPWRRQCVCVGPRTRPTSAAAWRCSPGRKPSGRKWIPCPDQSRCCTFTRKPYKTSSVTVLFNIWRFNLKIIFFIAPSSALANLSITRLKLVSSFVKTRWCNRLGRWISQGLILTEDDPYTITLTGNNHHKDTAIMSSRVRTLTPAVNLFKMKTDGTFWRCGAGRWRDRSRARWILQRWQLKRCSRPTPTWSGTAAAERPTISSASAASVVCLRGHRTAQHDD